MRKLAIIIVLMLNIFVANAQIKSSNNKVDLNQSLVDSIKKVQSNIKILQYELDAVKRDKLNYEIEKEILKNSFSDNMQILNVILAALLLFFSIIGGLFGYLGFKNITETKNKFSDELNSLINLKNSYTKRFSGLISREKEFIQRMNEIEEINSVQSKKIRMLELKNKLREIMKNKNYKQALSLIEIGLEDEENEYHLNFTKSIALARLRKYTEAAEISLKTLEIARETEKDSSIFIAHNLLEFTLFSKNIKNYNKYKKEYSEYLRYQTIVIYFEALTFYIKKDETKLKGILIKYLESSPKIFVFPGWSFEDSITFIENNPENSCNDIMLDFIATLNKKTTLDEFIKRYK